MSIFMVFSSLNSPFRDLLLLTVPRLDTYVAGAAFRGDLHLIQRSIEVRRLVGMVIDFAEPLVHDHFTPTGAGMDARGNPAWYANRHFPSTAGGVYAITARDSLPNPHLHIASTSRGQNIQVILNFRQHHLHVAPSGISQDLGNLHTGEIELLPALPKAWRDGVVTGLRARGGFEVDIEWRNGALDHATIKSVGGTVCKVRYLEKVSQVNLRPGGKAKVIL
jgi:hypothetical protein